MMAAFTLLVLSVTVLASAAPTGPTSLNVSFHQSVTLSRKILQDVHTLIVKYKQVKIGNPSFEDYSLLLNSLPSSRMDYGHWLEMQDEERLLLNYNDLQVFWMHVDTKWVHELGQTQASVLIGSIEGISLDLRDLISQLNGQISALSSTSPDPPDVTLPHNVLNPAYDWYSKLQGYIIFRDLELYLNKVIRDFTLLKNKYRK
ncbi:cardiotrophin-2-like [Heptranchias perlo]|uniref:cardiotrophin-2-like n=1 Tax=Heptranchias perlo TaxID=212740 RepID=UPI00355A8173